MTKDEACRLFSKEYIALAEKDKDIFAESVNRILQVNYIPCKKYNREIYTFYKDNEKLFQTYFFISDLDFGIELNLQVAYLKNIGNFNKMSLNKLESLILLVLRMLYQRLSQEITLSDEISVNYSDLHKELLTVKAIDDKIKKNTILEILKKYRSYNLIDYINFDFDEDTRIVIEPSVMLAVSFESMKDIVDKVESYKKGNKENEETDED